MKPYAIVCPQYDHTSGGIKVMYGLYGHLLARGYEVYMNQFPEGDVIAIYPEIVGGNPINATTVVRYILNKLGVMHTGGMEPLREIDPTEHNYYFSRIFGDTDDDHYMFLPIINTDIFKDQGKKRDKRAVFVGKGEDLGLHKPGAIIIDRSLAQDQQELADLLNECSVIHQYDPISAMSEVARLCGCRVELLNDQYSRDDYETKYEPGANGISFGSQEHEELDTEAFREHYMQMKVDFKKQLDKFIEETQK